MEVILSCVPLPDKVSVILPEKLCDSQRTSIACWRERLRGRETGIREGEKWEYHTSKNDHR